MTKTDKKILIINGDAKISASLSELFKNKLEIITASDGKEGLNSIKQSGPFAVIISDLVMDDMDGLDFLRQVKKQCPDTVCATLTSSVDTDIIARAVNESLIFRLLTKPSSSKQMQLMISECINHHMQLLAMTTYTYTAIVEGQGLVMTDFSEGCMAVTGYEAYDFVHDKKLWLSMVMPEDRLKVQGALNNIIAGKEINPVEYMIRRSDGSSKGVRHTIILHHNKQGEAYRCHGTVEDITDRKNIDDELIKSKERLQRMIANVPGMVYQLILKTDGTIELPFISDRCKVIFETEAKVLESDSNILMDMICSDDKAEFFRLMAESAEKLTPLEWSGKIVVNGTEKVIRTVSRPERLANGDTLWDGIALDITDMRRREEEVNSLLQFPDENPNPVMRISSKGRIVYANRACGLLLKCWGKTLNQLLPDNIIEIANLVWDSGSSNSIEIDCKDHRYFVAFIPVPESNYVNLYGYDITEVSRNEVELTKKNEILKEHDRLKSEFVSTVSHELRTPLCIFKNVISNVMAGVMGNVSGKLYDNMKLADKSIDRLSRIISDFLDISKIESGAMKLNLSVMPVQQVVNEAVESLRILASVKKISLKSDMFKHDLLVNIDYDRMIQILTNLIGNAIKFIPINGNITVYVTEQGDDVEVAVQDDGAGLRRDEMASIFDRFVQMHNLKGAGEHGTGLGLTITKELVQMHNGRIWVDSSPGKGCCFHVILPKHGTFESNRNVSESEISDNAESEK
jgi:PAS domain S-box-containing protein